MKASDAMKTKGIRNIMILAILSIVVIVPPNDANGQFIYVDLSYKVRPKCAGEREPVLSGDSFSA